MIMTWDELEEAVRDARRTLESFDRRVNSIAYLITGRLRAGKVSAHTLRKLKKELREFNMHTGQWKK